MHLVWISQQILEIHEVIKCRTSKSHFIYIIFWQGKWSSVYKDLPSTGRCILVCWRSDSLRSWLLLRWLGQLTGYCWRWWRRPWVWEWWRVFCALLRICVWVRSSSNALNKHKLTNQRKTIINSWVRCLENNQLVITSAFPTVNFRKW